MVEWEVESKHIVTSNYSFGSSVNTHTHTAPPVQTQPPTARTVVGDMSWSEDSAVAALMVAMLSAPDLASMFDFATRPEALSQRPPRPLRLIVPLSTAAISA